jgi:hypothetical protein
MSHITPRGELFRKSQNDVKLHRHCFTTITENFKVIVSYKSILKYTDFNISLTDCYTRYLSWVQVSWTHGIMRLPTLTLHTCRVLSNRSHKMSGRYCILSHGHNCTTMLYVRSEAFTAAEVNRIISSCEQYQLVQTDWRFRKHLFPRRQLTMATVMVPETWVILNQLIWLLLENISLTAMLHHFSQLSLNFISL